VWFMKSGGGELVGFGEWGMDVTGDGCSWDGCSWGWM
jgi:hypothetical protein